MSRPDLRRPAAAPDHDALLAEIVGRHGDLGEFVAAEPNAYAFLNAVWRLSTTAGQFVVKRHVAAVTPQRLDWTARLLDFLQRTRFPSDRIIRAQDGSAALVLDGRAYTVHTFLQGECYRGGMARLTEAQRVSAVDGLARLHSLTSQLRLPERLPPLADGADPGEDPRPLLYSEDVAGLRAYCEQAMGLAPAGFAGELDRVFDELADFYRGEDYPALGRQLVHGDYRHKNMVFQGQSFAGLFDWDFVQYAPRLVDVCGRFAQHYLSVTGTAGAAGIDSYLAAYRDAARRHGTPLTAAEQAALPLMLRAGVIHTGVVVAAFLCRAPLMADETPAARRDEAARRLALSRAQLSMIDRLWPPKASSGELT